jgi:hypothetical protein
LKIGFFYTLVAVAVISCPLDERERDRLVSILMFGGLATSVYGLVQQVMGGERLVQLGYHYNEQVRFAGGFLRSFSTFNLPFPFAFYLCMVMLVCLPVALRDRRRLRNRIFLYGIPMMSLALLLTVVRTALLGLFAGLIVLAVGGVPGVRRVLPTLLAVALVGASVLLVLESGTLSATSLQDRGTTWSDNLSDVVEHPFGHGIGSLGAAALRADEQELGREAVIELNEAGQQALIPDNQYFTWAYSLGVPGLWVFVRLLAAFLGTTRRALTSPSGTQRDLALGVRAFVVAFMIWCFFANAMEAFPIDVYMWLLIGLVTPWADPAALPDDRKRGQAIGR